MNKNKAIIILLVFFLALAGITYVDIKGVDGEGTASASDITLGLDLAGGVSITYQVVGEETPDAADMKDTIDKLQQRVFTYSTEALVYQEGTDRSTLKFPGYLTPTRFWRSWADPVHSILFMRGAATARPITPRSTRRMQTVIIRSAMY